MMLTTPVASQNKAFPLAGTLNRLSLSESDRLPTDSGLVRHLCGSLSPAQKSLSESHTKRDNSPSLPVRRNLLIKFNCAEMEQSANSLILAQSCHAGGGEIKDEQCSPSVKPDNYSGSPEHYRYSGSKVIQHGCNNENQHVTGKEKGGTENTALCGYGFYHHEENQQRPVLNYKIKHDSSNLSYKVNQHLAAWHIRTYETFVGQSSGDSLDFLRWRRLISPCKADTTNCPMLSPSSLSSSTELAISCGTRTSNLFDFAFTDFVAITGFPVYWCPTIIHVFFCIESIDLSDTLHLLCVRHLDYSQGVETAKPGSVSPLTGPLTTNDRLRIEVAMLNHTQTRPKFQYLFLAVHRSDLNAKPHRESVTAHSEQDARRSLAGQFVLSFAGRLPEVNYA